MKNYMLIAISFTLGAITYGQTLEEAIKKTDNERYDLATKDFRSLIAKEPTKGDYYFYLGDNFYKQGELDSAYAAWNQGAKMDPVSPLGMVGAGNVLWHKGDTAGGRKLYVAACTATKHKNAEIMRQAAKTYTYAEKKNIDAAIKLLNDAIKLEPKNIDAHLILGDALLEKTPSNGSPAIAEYNKALDIDSKNCKGIVKKAKLYQRSKAYEEANGLYKEAQTLDPTYAPAYRENAELNMMFNQYSRAIENWKKYLELNNSDEARYRFATSLFSAKKYCEAIPELETLHENGYVKLYTRRMLTYSLYECNGEKKTEINKKGLAESDLFFQIVPQEKIIGLDYKYRGLHYIAMGSDSIGILELEKAMAIDSLKRGELAGDIAKLYMKAKKYDDVIRVYNILWDGNNKNMNANQFFELGRAYYFGPKNYAMADSCFKGLTEKVPDYAQGYLWRARANYKLDANNSNYFSKPYYELFLTKLTEEEKADPNQKSYILEAARYLGDYYVISKTGKDNEKAKMYWGMVKELEPTDAQAKAFFASPAGR